MNPDAATPPQRMDPDDTKRMRTAAYTATRLLPPFIGKHVNQELTDWADFGYRLGSTALVWGLVADLEDLARQKAQEREAFAGTASEVHR